MSECIPKEAMDIIASCEWMKQYGYEVYYDNKAKSNSCRWCPLDKRTDLCLSDIVAESDESCTGIICGVDDVTSANRDFIQVRVNGEPDIQGLLKEVDQRKAVRRVHG